MKSGSNGVVVLAATLCVLAVTGKAWAQNLDVKGTTTGEGNAYFYQNVGIGTTAPYYRLQVMGSTGVVSPDQTRPYGLGLERVNEDGRRHIWQWWHMNRAAGQDSLILFEYQTDSAGITCGGNASDGAMCAARLTVQKGGNVGIGTRSTVGNATCANCLGWGGSLNVNGEVHAARYYDDDVNYYVDANSTSQMYSLNLAGNLGIGTNSPESKLHVNVDVRSEFGRMLTFGGLGAGGTSLLDDPAGDATILATRGSGLWVSNTSKTANSPAFASAFYITSSRSVKTDIADAHYGLAAIVQLRPKSYRYINDPGQGMQLGFIAEDVDQVLPEVVGHDRDGKPIAIDYSKLSVALVGSVKELQEQLRAQQALLESQQSEIVNLKAQIRGLMGR